MVSNTDIGETMKAQELETYIDHFEEVWEFPFEEYVDQLKQWYREGIVDENTNLYVWVGSSKYAVQNFQDFVTLSVDDLTLLVRAGTRFVGLLKGQTLTPKILDAIREKLQTELITQINTEKK